MRARWLFLVGLALSLIAPVAAPGERRGGGAVDATVEVERKQAQAGKSIRISTLVSAQEPVTVTGSGRVRLNGRTYPAPPKVASENVGAGGGLNFKFVPAKNVRVKIARALTDGERPVAHVRVNVTDGSGSLLTESYVVTLTKFVRGERPSA